MLLFKFHVYSVQKVVSWFGLAVCCCLDHRLVVRVDHRLVPPHHSLQEVRRKSKPDNLGFVNGVVACGAEVVLICLAVVSIDVECCRRADSSVCRRSICVNYVSTS